ncbi:hypothetical protein GCM10011389_12680 [Pontibacillus salipaludis]|uniref:Uncharacterized protein n=1 Tax=Pontibacillus salipaludis TaxID=1697394 RepID=A0ABQ1PY35_9BACI|nr:hypothetical protein GCM10011389_12680 [Pontibacillus salipaludis]
MIKKLGLTRLIWRGVIQLVVIVCIRFFELLLNYMNSLFYNGVYIYNSILA